MSRYDSWADADEYYSSGSYEFRVLRDGQRLRMQCRHQESWGIVIEIVELQGLRFRRYHFIVHSAELRPGFTFLGDCGVFSPCYARWAWPNRESEILVRSMIRNSAIQSLLEWMQNTLESVLTSLGIRLDEDELPQHPSSRRPSAARKSPRFDPAEYIDDFDDDISLWI